MTATELFQYVAEVMGQSVSNASTYNGIYLSNLNLILADTFKLENNNREYLGLAKLTTYPVITNTSEVIPYQDNIIRNVLVWGLARQFALSEDDTPKYNIYAQSYMLGYDSENKVIHKDIIDYYSTESL